jgi:hypothetical protein
VTAWRFRSKSRAREAEALFELGSGWSRIGRFERLLSSWLSPWRAELLVMRLAMRLRAVKYAGLTVLSNVRRVS